MEEDKKVLFANGEAEDLASQPLEQLAEKFEGTPVSDSVPDLPSNQAQYAPMRAAYEERFRPTTKDFESTDVPLLRSSVSGLPQGAVQIPTSPAVERNAKLLMDDHRAYQRRMREYAEAQKNARRKDCEAGTHVWNVDDVMQQVECEHCGARGDIVVRT